MYELGRRFQFFINKIENNTLHISQIIQNGSDFAFNNNINVEPVPCLSNATINNNNATAAAYDSSGAAKYIVVVVLVYGFGIIFFIGSQVRSTKKFSDEVDSVNAEKILRSMETEIFTKEVLEKLSDKDHRERAWKIYLAPNNANSNENSLNKSRSYDDSNKALFDDNSLKEIDKEAFHSIEKKLKDLNRTQSKKGMKTSDIYNSKIKSHRSSSVKSYSSMRDSKDTNRFSFKLIDNFVKKNKKNHRTVSSVTPLLILQTDVDGLMKLKQAKYKNRAEKYESNKLLRSEETTNSKDFYTSKSSLSSLDDDQNLGGSKHSLKSVSSEKFSNSAKKTNGSTFRSPNRLLKANKRSDNQNISQIKSLSNDHSNVSFDICEISEQITSV